MLPAHAGLLGPGDAMIPDQPVSTLSDVLETAELALRTTGDGTVWQVGKQYLAQEAGSPPRVVFVPDEQGPGLGPPIQINAGLIAALTHKCLVYCQASDPGDDTQQAAPLYALVARVTNALRASAPGRVAFGGLGAGDRSLLPVPAYGRSMAFSFVYTADIAEDREIRAAVAKAFVARAPLDPDRPEGDTGQTATLTVTTERQ